MKLKTHRRMEIELEQIKAEESTLEQTVELLEKRFKSIKEENVCRLLTKVLLYTRFSVQRDKLWLKHWILMSPHSDLGRKLRSRPRPMLTIWKYNTW